MKTLNVTFTDAEFNRLKKTRKWCGMSWHDFIIFMEKSGRECELNCLEGGK